MAAGEVELRPDAVRRGLTALIDAHRRSKDLLGQKRSATELRGGSLSGGDGAGLLIETYCAAHVEIECVGLACCEGSGHPGLVVEASETQQPVTQASVVSGPACHQPALASRERAPCRGHGLSALAASRERCRSAASLQSSLAASASRPTI